MKGVSDGTPNRPKLHIFSLQFLSLLEMLLKIYQRDYLSRWH